MKLRNRITTLASAVFLTTALASAPAIAQTTSGDQARNSSTARADDGRDFNYGWLGLLGLAGLMGLKRRDRDDDHVTGRPVTR